MRTFLGQSVPNIVIDADFPKGTAKDDSPLGSKNGTPVTEKAGIADCYNALLAVMNEAGIAPNETPEKQVGGSQFLEALRIVIAKRFQAKFKFWNNTTFSEFGSSFDAEVVSNGELITIFLPTTGPQEVSGVGSQVICLVMVDDSGSPITTFPEKLQPSQNLSGSGTGISISGATSYETIVTAIPAYIYDKFIVFFWNNSGFGFEAEALSANGGDDVGISRPFSVSYLKGTI